LKAFSVSLFHLIAGNSVFYAQDADHSGYDVQGSSAWFDQTIGRIENRDTTGLRNQLSAALPPKVPAENQFRQQLARCYLILYTDPDPLDRKEIDERLHLDSLVHTDSLHTLARFIQGYYYFATSNYPIALEFLNGVSLELNNTASSLCEARCFMLRSNIQLSLDYPDEAEEPKTYLAELLHEWKRSRSMTFS